MLLRKVFDNMPADASKWQPVSQVLLMDSLFLCDVQHQHNNVDTTVLSLGAGFRTYNSHVEKVGRSTLLQRELRIRDGSEVVHIL